MRLYLTERYGEDPHVHVYQIDLTLEYAAFLPLVGGIAP
jgi:hypothetical protein